MTLSVDQVANTTATAFDVRHRYFAGTFFNLLTLTSYAEGATPTGWTISGDTITPASGWTEITDRIYGRGQWTQELRSSSVTWTASLSGTRYDDNYIGVGRAILCMERIEVHGYRLIANIDPSVFIFLGDASEWPVTGGTGHIDGDDFSYTGVFQGTTLIGVTGLSGYHWAGEPCARTYGWRLAWMGMVENSPWTDDYRHGANWTISVRSNDASLNRTDSPRIRTGSIDVIDGSSVTSTTTLATPVDEVGNNEFVGVTTTLSPQNIVDGRLDTVWISQGVPTITGEDDHTTTSELVIDEVFFKPVVGWSPYNTWWVELFHNSDTERDLPKLWLFTTNIAGQDVVTFMNLDIKLPARGRVILCPNRDFFEAYTGGVPSGATIVETTAYATYLYSTENVRFQNWGSAIDPSWVMYDFATSTAAQFNLSGSNGWVGVVTRDTVTTNSLPCYFTGYLDTFTPPFWSARDVVQYSINGDPVDGGGIDELGNQWNNEPVDVTDIVAGQSIRRSSTGNDDTSSALDWTIETFPRAGDKWNANETEWVKIVLPENVTQLDAGYTAGELTLTVDTTLGWPEPLAGSTYQGIIDNSEVFTYTALTSTTITLESGLASSYIKTALVNPYFTHYLAGMTGWPIRRIDIERRVGLSKIEQADVYISPWASANDYDQDNFQIDYYFDSPQRIGNSSSYVLEWLGTEENTPGFRWIRTIMIVIHKMSDNGRAKINRVKAYLVNANISGSGESDIASSTPASVLKKILADYSWLTTDDITDNTPYTMPGGTTNLYGQTGQISMAIAPFPKVLDDVAKSHGLWVRYGLEGKVYFDRDPWWTSGTTGDDGVLLGFYGGNVRGTMSYSSEDVDITGLSIAAHLPDGTALPIKYATGGAQTGSGIMQLSDYVVVSEEAAQTLADILWYKERHSEHLSLTVKGLGEWCRVGQRFWITWDLDNLGFERDVSGGRAPWICEKVMRTWDMTGDQRKWKVTLDLRLFAGV